MPPSNHPNLLIVKTTANIAISRGSLDYQLIRSSRRRTLAICIDDEAKLKVYAPSRMMDGMIHRFIREKERWIEEHLEKARKRIERTAVLRFEHGANFFFLGEPYVLHIIEKNIKQGYLSFDGKQWVGIIPTEWKDLVREAKIKKLFEQWFRKQANKFLLERIKELANTTELKPLRVQVRTHKRIWGNCEFKSQTIRLNWKIIHFPVEVIDYILIHELCHLAVPNHSRRFWKKVACFIPDYQESRRWLRAHASDKLIS